MFKKYLFVLLMLLYGANVFAQNRYVVYFTDKNNSAYSISSPLGFLSQRAIDRRTKQNIAIDSLDLPVNDNYIQGVMATGATVLNISKWLNTASIEVADSNMLAAVTALPYVINSSNIGRPTNSNNMQLRKSNKFENETSSAIPLNTLNKTTSLLQYGASYNQVHMLNGDVLHDAGYQGEGMIIAMMDAGFLDANITSVYDSIWATNRLIIAKDFVNPQGNVFNEFYHGAACFSILGANSPGVLMGTAPQASYMLLRSEDVSSEYLIEEYNWASAAEFADSAGADAFSTSLGYTTFDDPAQNHTYATLNGSTAPMSIATGIAASRGIVVINSAGNEGGSAWNYISVPSDAFNMLATGAVDSAQNYASFSGNGPSYDGRVKPDVAAQGAGTYYCSPFDGLIYSGNGTSFSGPVLAGLATCLWQQFNNFTAMQIVDAIKRSASIYSSPDTLIGYGIPDFATAATLLTVNEICNNKSFGLYPNPAHDVINIVKENRFEKLSYTISDVTGRILLTGFVAEQISIAKLPAGIYYITLQNQDKQVQKFIKQ